MDIPSVDYILDEAAKYNMAIWQVVLKEEQADSGETEEEIRSKLEKAYQVMKDAAMGGISSEMKSVSGLTGGDAAKYYRHYKNRKNMMGSLEAKAMSYSLGTSEYNAAMGIIVAAPTCGSSGILPGVMIAAQEEFGFTDREAINGLITAGGIGAVIATRATISGAAQGLPGRSRFCGGHGCRRTDRGDGRHAQTMHPRCGHRLEKLPGPCL